MKYVSSQQNGGSKLIASNANFSPFSPRSIFLIFYSKGLGKDPATKSDEFLEKLQTAFDPPPHFWKIMLQFFIMDRVAYMLGGIHEGQIL